MFIRVETVLDGVIYVNGDKLDYVSDSDSGSNLVMDNTQYTINSTQSAEHIFELLKEAQLRGVYDTTRITRKNAG